MSKNRVENIFKRYSAPLLAFIKGQVSSDDDSEDLLQDIFYKFIVNDYEDREIENISAWLYRVARNLIIDRSRKQKEEKMPYVIEGETLKQTPISEILLFNENTPEDDTITSFIDNELRDALDKLPTQQRVVYELNELQGIPFAEISETTGVAINTLISRKRYAVQFLRKELGYLVDP